MTFAAEEQGLLGSKYFNDNPTIELGDIAAMLNLDMVGYGDGNVGIGGGEYFPELWKAFRSGLDDSTLSLL